MPRVTPALVTFNGGEWDPALHARVDLAKYDNACRMLENFLPLVQGAATRRPGTFYVGETKNSAAVRLIPFEFSVEQAYIIEAGDGYFRFYKDGGIIMDGADPYEVATPYGTSDLAMLKWTQSADILYLVHPDHAPRQLTRAGHTNWTLSEPVFTDGPYLAVNTSETTLIPSATTGTGITITASATEGINGGDGFVAADTGRLIRLKHGDVWGWVRITGITSTTVVTVDVKGTLGDTTATALWRLGAWYTNNYPSCVSFHEDRLIFADTPSRPQSLWASMSGDYTHFAPSDADGIVADDHSITVTIADDRVNAILWLASMPVLLLGTAGGLFALQASSLNEAITPANVTVRRQTTAAAADRLPVKIGRATLFVQRMGKKLLAADYALDRDAYAAEDMSLLAHHLLREGIAAIVHQAEPHGIVWSVTEGGELLGLTYLAAQDVIAWHRHPLGGTDVAVLSVAAIPTEGQDELWLVVERSIDGQTVRTVERLTAPIAPVDENDKDDLFFVDCGLSYTGVPATEISGLDHLEGETVSILADGAAHPDRVVTDGAVTLMRSASSVHVGLGYTSRLTTLDLNAGSAAGTALGKPTRVHAVTVRFLETLGAHAGFDADHLDPVLFRTGASSMDASPPLYTGFKRIAFPKGWDRAARVHVTQNQPLPCTITAIVPHVTTNEG